MPRKCTILSKEEKRAIVKSVLSGTSAQKYEDAGVVDHHTVMNWVRKYLGEISRVSIFFICNISFYCGLPILYNIF